MVKVEELALQRKRFAHLTDEQWRWMLQQVEGKQRTRDKLPTFAQIEDWWYPVRISCEQCSSELTARYKAKLIDNILSSKKLFIDLTGGYGVDTFFISEHFERVHYVEQNEELCRIAAHNFAISRPNICVHNATAEEFLAEQTIENSDAAYNLIYIDPARRDKNGEKVFRIEDCEPNVATLLPTIRDKANTIVIKLSPMLDITAALTSLGGRWDVHVIAVKNEVKEVLLCSCSNHLQSYIHSNRTDTISPIVYTTNILTTSDSIDPEKDHFVFTQEEEKNAHCCIYHPKDNPISFNYIYEPNAAIIKAGAFKLVAQRYQLCKMAPHTHLYMADHLIENFPGRVWQVIESNIKDAKNIAANILTRNYPMTPEQLRKKLKTKDSDTHTIIGARLADKPTLFLCKKV